MKPKYWYIKERHNPQFDKPYYVALGNITKDEAIKAGMSLYGYNNILRIDTEQEYRKKIKELGIKEPRS